MQQSWAGQNDGFALVVRMQWGWGGPGRWLQDFQARSGHIHEKVLRTTDYVLDVTWITSRSGFLPRCQTRWSAARCTEGPLRATTVLKAHPVHHAAPSPLSGWWTASSPEAAASGGSLRWNAWGTTQSCRSQPVDIQKPPSGHLTSTAKIEAWTNKAKALLLFSWI